MSGKRTPFYDLHVSLKAKMTDFAGFEMPVHYSEGINAEHEIVRTGVGVFDVSHRGEFEITGQCRSADCDKADCGQAACQDLVAIHHDLSPGCSCIATLCRGF